MRMIVGQKYAVDLQDVVPKEQTMPAHGDRQELADGAHNCSFITNFNNS
jgi:hypothetical protein